MDFENKNDEKEPIIINHSSKSLKGEVSSDGVSKQIKSNSALQQIVEHPNEKATIGGTLKHCDSTNSKEEGKSTKKGTNTSLGIKVGPEIFVSLKKGSMDQYYTIGKTLGEGEFLRKIRKKFKTFFLHIKELLGK